MLLEAGKSNREVAANTVGFKAEMGFQTNKKNISYRYMGRKLTTRLQNETRKIETFERPNQKH